MLKIQKSYDNFFYGLFLAFTIVAIGAIFYINEQKFNRLQGYYESEIEKISVAYEAAVDKYSFYTEKIFIKNIQASDNIENLYYAINSKDETTRRYYKGVFYRDFYPLFSDLKKDGIRQLHFHLKDNTSFLRFHYPATYKDDLTLYRPSIVYVNKNKKPISLFETGRVISGFRNIYPLEDKGAYLGSVEISVSSKSVIDSLNTLLPDHEFQFLLNAKLTDFKLFESQKHLYSKSMIHPDFVHEDSNAILPDSPKPLSQIAKQIDTLLKSNKELEILMNKKEKIARFFKIEGTYYNVILFPILGLENRLEGYLISYAKASNIPPIVDLIPWFLSTIAAGYIFIIFLLVILRTKSKEISEQKNWFLDVTDSLGEGLYVIDTNANIIYINPMACKILGYTKDELLGKSAHDTFHSHNINEYLPLEECPILLGVKENGFVQNIDEAFLTKDGRKVWVEINSRALYKDNSLYQIVTTFKDISIKKELEDRMKLLTKALESSSNAVVITDANAIVSWANPAFEHLTGYKITEAIGKQPKELVRSGKQSETFYAQMWETILAKKPWSGEIINKKKDGTLYYEELHITPVLNSKREIQHFIAIKQDISERKEREKSIEHHAYYDYLTNLPNRRLFNEHCLQVFKSLPREKKYVALLLLDLDGFKNLNDTHGHDLGDVLLREVAIRLESSIRAKDIVARLGGDEFVVMLDNLPVDIKKAQEVSTLICSKLLETIRKPFSLKQVSYQTSLSIGVYLFNTPESNVENALKKADVALYEAKAKGRNTYHFYE